MKSQTTLDYLFNDLLPRESLFETHGFIRDRTRSIRQDFTLQNERGRIAIECHERIARYHILCLHFLRDKEGVGSYQEQQELEQVRKGKQSHIKRLRNSAIADWLVLSFAILE